jgi:hypothetical protein
MKSPEAREKFNQYRREWRRLNPDKVKAQDSRNYRKYRDKKLAKAKAQRESGYSREYYKKNKEKILACSLKYYNRTKRSILGICGCCEKEKMLVRDHCHASGRKRERICTNCNIALGHAKDSIENLRLMISYLERHNAVAIEETSSVGTFTSWSEGAGRQGEGC